MAGHGRFSFGGLSLSKAGPLPTAFSRRALVAAAAAGAATGAWQLHSYVSKHPERLKLPAPLVEAFAGALGEVAQITVLYPLDTIKVRCQATEQNAGVVLRDVLKGGANMALLRKLYAGALGAALCSIMVGAVHYASYESSRRTFMRLINPSLKCDSDDVNDSIIDHSRAFSAALHSTHNAAATPDGQQPQQQQPEAQQQHQQHASQTGKMAATFLAAAFAAAATAVVESPVELFRHNAQAGLVQPNFLAEMTRTVRAEGVGGLYWGFLPHCFEAWPHDISELLMYGFCRDVQASAMQPGARHNALVSKLPVDAWDLITGAASGTAAVVVSMPFDTVKTYLQTHGTDLTNKGLWGSARLFLKTGRRLAAKRGVQALYVGVTPRLMQQVPSACVCWWVIEAFKRAMEPYTAK